VESRRWALQDAKNRFSQVAEEAIAYGPQVVTRRGRDVVVLVSTEEYARLTRPRATLAEFLLASPLPHSGLEVERDGTPGRDAAL